MMSSLGPCHWHTGWPKGQCQGSGLRLQRQPFLGSSATHLPDRDGIRALSGGRLGAAKGGAGGDGAARRETRHWRG